MPSTCTRKASGHVPDSALELKQLLTDVVAAGSMVLCGPGWQTISRQHRAWQANLRQAVSRSGRTTQSIISPVITLGVFDTLLTIYQMKQAHMAQLDPPVRALIEAYQRRVT